MVGITVTVKWNQDDLLTRNPMCLPQGLGSQLMLEVTLSFLDSASQEWVALFRGHSVASTFRVYVSLTKGLL